MHFTLLETVDLKLSAKLGIINRFWKPLKKYPHVVSVPVIGKIVTAKSVKTLIFL